MIITGGQDNCRRWRASSSDSSPRSGARSAVPYVAHSRGWTAEDMEENVTQVATSKDLQDGVRALVDRALHAADRLSGDGDLDPLSRGGRKAHRLE